MQHGPLKSEILDAYDTMSAQLQAAARFVLDRPHEVALLSMREQARQAGVQPATMTRLAKHLGLNGYDEIRERYAEAVRGGGLGFVDKATSQQTTQRLKGDRAIAADMLSSLHRQVEHLASPETLDSIVAAADALARARRIYCLGLRSSHAVAWHLHYQLTLIGRHSVHVDGLAATGTDSLAHAGPEDILLAVSVSPYTRLTVELAEHMAARGVPVVAITDSTVAPLAHIARHTVLVPTDSPSFFHTVSPGFAVAEMLAAIIAGRGGDDTLTSLAHVDAHHVALGSHIQPRPNQPRSTKRPT
ncbi:MurR/RpiR family transcriptional regulator [Radicibacter daui]|uniref:MurR/RpiR family transcriptional regulator n=1 Tax=Radicibacter daui TaxID=3064829 RepID=UPI00404699E3